MRNNKITLKIVNKLKYCTVAVSRRLDYNNERLTAAYMEKLSETEIIKRVQNGEINLFELLVKKYSRTLHFFTERKVGSNQDAQDIVQNTFISAYKAIEKFDLSKSFYPLLFTILKNEIARFFRENKKDLRLIDEIIAASSNFDSKMEVDYILRNIKPQYAQVLKLYYIEGYSYIEISAKLDKPINTIKTILRRAKIEGKKIYEK